MSPIAARTVSRCAALADHGVPMLSIRSTVKGKRIWPNAAPLLADASTVE